MKKQIILPILGALLITASIVSLGKLQTAHAQINQTVTANKIQADTIKKETAELTTVEEKTTKSVKNKETDLPGGHQDLQNTNANHNFQGEE